MTKLLEKQVHKMALRNKRNSQELTKDDEDIVPTSKPTKSEQNPTKKRKINYKKKLTVGNVVSPEPDKIAENLIRKRKSAEKIKEIEKPLPIIEPIKVSTVDMQYENIRSNKFKTASKAKKLTDCIEEIKNGNLQSSFLWKDHDAIDKKIIVRKNASSSQLEIRIELANGRHYEFNPKEITQKDMEKLIVSVDNHKIRILSKPNNIQIANDYPKLGDDKMEQIMQWINGNDVLTILTRKFGINIERREIRALQWDTNIDEENKLLDDNVINFYMELLAERSRQNDKMPKVHGMNTFFLKRLQETGYSGVRRWTRKVDIFAHDIIPVPVHKGIHWCMAIIHLKNKTIKYYDSMGTPNNPVLNALHEYLKAESLDKKKVELDMSEWKMENVRNIPQQENGSDCGVFSCMYAEFITRNRPIVFTQQHMQYFRMKMVYEICSGQMLN